jgi:hypothetical protein
MTTEAVMNKVKDTSHPDINKISDGDLEAMVSHGFRGINCSLIIALYLAHPEMAEKFFKEDNVRAVIVQDLDEDLAHTAARYHLVLELTGPQGQITHVDPKGRIDRYKYTGVEVADLGKAIEAVFDATLKTRAERVAKENGLTFDGPTFDSSVQTLIAQAKAHVIQADYAPEILTEKTLLREFGTGVAYLRNVAAGVLKTEDPSQQAGRQRSLSN